MYKVAKVHIWLGCWYEASLPEEIDEVMACCSSAGFGTVATCISATDSQMPQRCGSVFLSMLGMVQLLPGSFRTAGACLVAQARPVSLQMLSKNPLRPSGHCMAGCATSGGTVPVIGRLDPPPCLSACAPTPFQQQRPQWLYAVSREPATATTHS